MRSREGKDGKEGWKKRGRSKFGVPKPPVEIAPDL